MPVVPFSISVRPGAAKIVVDGQDVSDQTRAFRLDASVDTVPVLTIQTHAEGTIEGEAIVQVTEGTNAADLVRQIDAEALKQAVLAKSGYGTNEWETIIETIAGWLE